MNWPTNLTAYNKFLYPMVGATILWINQKWGLAIPNTDADVIAYVGYGIALIGLFSPKNKEA